MGRMIEQIGLYAFACGMAVIGAGGLTVAGGYLAQSETAVAIGMAVALAGAGEAAVSMAVLLAGAVAGGEGA